MVVRNTVTPPGSIPGRSNFSHVSRPVSAAQPLPFYFLFFFFRVFFFLFPFQVPSPHAQQDAAPSFPLTRPHPFPIPLSFNQKKEVRNLGFGARPPSESVPRDSDTPPSIGPRRITSPQQGHPVFSFEKTDDGADRPSRRPEDHAFVQAQMGEPMDESSA